VKNKKKIYLKDTSTLEYISNLWVFWPGTVRAVVSDLLNSKATWLISINSHLDFSMFARSWAAWLDWRTIFAGPYHHWFVNVEMAANEMSDAFVCVTIGLSLVLHYVVPGHKRTLALRHTWAQRSRSQRISFHFLFDYIKRNNKMVLSGILPTAARCAVWITLEMSRVSINDFHGSVYTTNLMRFWETMKQEKRFC
jgi:hypothetical protein